jgi:hypothetical protein
MASVPLEYYYNEGRWQDVIAVAGVILQYYPKDVSALVTKGSAYGHLAEEKFQQKYPTPSNRGKFPGERLERSIYGRSMRFEVFDFVRSRTCSMTSAASACPGICPGYDA